MDFKLSVNNNEFSVGEFNTRLKNIKEKITRAIGNSLYTIEGNAKTACPVDTGGLRQSITAEIFTDQIGGRVVCMENIIPPIGAFVEFGTGKYAERSIPEGLEIYARTFYVNGKGHMPAKPFLFPAFFAEQERLLDVLKNKL